MWNIFVRSVTKSVQQHFHKLNTCARGITHVHSLLSSSPNLSAAHAQMHFTYHECFVVVNIDFVVQQDNLNNTKFIAKYKKKKKKKTMDNKNSIKKKIHCEVKKKKKKRQWLIKIPFHFISWTTNLQLHTRMDWKQSTCTSKQNW